MAERILVAGCGYVGSVLARALAGEGHRVWGLRRSVAPVGEGVAALAADLTDPALDRVLPDDLDLVFYTAAADGGSPEAYRAAYVDGLANLLSVLEGRGRLPRALLFTSSTSVYAQNDGSWVDEASPTQPPGHRGQIMLEAEARLGESPLATVALRLGGIYGPGRTRLLESVRDGRAVLEAGRPRHTNRIHRDDAAGALRHLAALADPPPLVLGVDDEPAERGDVLRWLAGQLGVAPPREAPSGPDPHDAGKRCSNALLRASGWSPHYPSFREGYREAIDALGGGS